MKNNGFDAENVLGNSDKKNSFDIKTSKFFWGFVGSVILLGTFLLTIYLWNSDKIGWSLIGFFTIIALFKFGIWKTPIDRWSEGWEKDNKRHRQRMEEMGVESFKSLEEYAVFEKKYADFQKNKIEEQRRAQQEFDGDDYGGELSNQSKAGILAGAVGIGVAHGIYRAKKKTHDRRLSYDKYVAGVDHGEWREAFKARHGRYPKNKYGD